MFRLRYAAVLLLLCTAQLFPQDYKKIAELIIKVEENLKTLIAAERKERQEQYSVLAARLNALQPQSEAKHASDKQEEKKHEALNVAPLLKRLQAGNVRFVKGTPAAKPYAKQRQETVKGQKPFVTVVTCSDSRVPPELIFDESVGQVFVIRVAGNVLDSAGLGSVEYAAEHLHSGLVMVLGHSSCGAVKATIEGGEVPPNIGSLVWKLRPAVEASKAKGVKDQQLENSAIEENVRLQVAAVTEKSDVMKHLVHEGKVKVVGALYHLESGVVTVLEERSYSDRVDH